MDRFTAVTGVAASLVRDNIDTDAIVPGDCLMQVAKSGFGHGLFANWRFADRGTPAEKECEDFVLNQPAFRQASILISGHNLLWFIARGGCGRSGLGICVCAQLRPDLLCQRFRNGCFRLLRDEHVSRLEELRACPTA